MALSSLEKSTVKISKEEANGYNFNPREERLINIMAKCLVLSIIYNITLLLIGVGNFIEDSLDTPDFVFGLVALDCLSNVSCLFMQFDFGQKKYDQYCSRCHHSIKSRITAFVLNHVESKQVKSIKVIPSNEI